MAETLTAVPKHKQWSFIQFLTLENISVVKFTGEYALCTACRMLSQNQLWISGYRDLSWDERVQAMNLKLVNPKKKDWRMPLAYCLCMEIMSESRLLPRNITNVRTDCPHPECRLVRVWWLYWWCFVTSKTEFCGFHAVYSSSSHQEWRLLVNILDVWGIPIRSSQVDLGPGT